LKTSRELADCPEGIGAFMEHVTYKMQGVCSSRVDFDLTDDGRIANCRFAGGCQGNLLAIAKLIEGEDARKVAGALLGNPCGSQATSCADQLAKAILNHRH
jgi:uncharacterized protein (TIGR03905 family)